MRYSLMTALTLLLSPLTLHAQALSCGDRVITAPETCDDGNGVNESCGDGTRQAGGPYCNNTCSATYVGGEGCDYTGGSCGGVGIARTSPTAECSTYCNTDCSACTKYCL